MKTEKRTIQPTNYKIGTIGVDLTLEGLFDDLSAAADRIAAITSAAITFETIGFIDRRWDMGHTKETINVAVHVGAVRLGLDFVFELNLDVPKIALESIVAGNVLPAAEQALGFCLSGDMHLVTTPVTHFAAVSDPLTDTAPMTSPSRRVAATNKR